MTAVRGQISGGGGLFSKRRASAPHLNTVYKHMQFGKVEFAQQPPSKIWTYFNYEPDIAIATALVAFIGVQD